MSSGTEEFGEAPPVLVTYLRTTWKLTEQNRDDLARWKLVEGRQTIKNISDHLSKCKSAGLLWRKDNKHKVSEADFFSSPSFTLVRNPSHKVWIERYDNIDETTAFNLLLFMGHKFSDYMLKKYGALPTQELTIRPVSDDDFIEQNFKLDLEWNGNTYYLFTIYNPKHKEATMRDQLHKLFKSGDIITIKELNQTLQSLYD